MFTTLHVLCGTMGRAAETVNGSLPESLPPVISGLYYLLLLKRNESRALSSAKITKIVTLLDQFPLFLGPIVTGL